jgi:hypothetical protein
MFQFSHPSKSAAQRKELASVEFSPTYAEDTGQQSWQTVVLEKRMAPVPGVNFTFGLGIGVAVIVERKTDEANTVVAFPPGSGFVRVKRIDVEFKGWQMA